MLIHYPGLVIKVLLFIAISNYIPRNCVVFGKSSLFIFAYSPPIDSGLSGTAAPRFTCIGVHNFIPVLTLALLAITINIH